MSQETNVSTIKVFGSFCKGPLNWAVIMMDDAIGIVLGSVAVDDVMSKEVGVAVGEDEGVVRRCRVKVWVNFSVEILVKLCVV